MASGAGAGASLSANQQRAPAWDADKIRRVLEGTAVVRVVDVDPPSSSSSSVSVLQSGNSAGKAPATTTAVAAAAAATEETNLKEVQAPAPVQHHACAMKLCASARETGLGVLEESMRALTLGKKSN